jgi:hypothetical protein
MKKDGSIAIKTKWFYDCKSEAEKAKRKEILLQNTYLLSVLKGMMEGDLRLLDKEMTSTKRYDDQSWAYRQADYIGSKRVYEKVIELLEISNE